MSDLQPLTAWTFISPCDIPDDVSEILVEGEKPVCAYKTIRDSAIFTNKRLIVRDKKGITRYGSMILPMDEALIIAAVDLSGRDALGYALNIPTEKVGDFDTELVKELWLGFVREAKCALHLNQLAGDNSHHIIEGAFKAAGRAFKAAVAINPEAADEIPSTKGVL